MFLKDPKHKYAAKKVFDVAAKALSEAINLTTSTTTLGKVAVAVNAVSTVIDSFEDSDIFDTYETVSLHHSIRKAVFCTLELHGKLKLSLSTKDHQIYRLANTDCDIVFIRHKSNLDFYGNPICKENVDKAITEIGKAIWECTGPNIRITYNTWGDEAKINKDPLSEPAKSVMASKIADECRAYKRSNKSRGLLFYGPPGTGKSYMMKAIADSLGGFNIRAQAKGSSMETLTMVCKLLKPSCVVIDDIDRTYVSHSLESVEILRKHCDVLMISANYVDNLDAAFARPGRFDKRYFINTAEPEVLEKLLKDVPVKDAEKLKELPVAYIKNYLDTRDILGQDKATESVTELVETHEQILGKDAPTVEPEKTLETC